MRKRKKNKPSNKSLIIAGVFILFLAISGYSRVKFRIPEEKDSVGGLSYLVIHLEEEMRMMITAPDGKVSNEFVNDIDRAIFGLALPIVNSLHLDKVLGGKYWEFEQKYPQKGIYRIEIRADSLVNNIVWIMSMDKEGEDFIHNEKHDVDAKGVIFELNNDPENSENTTLNQI